MFRNLLSCVLRLTTPLLSSLLSLFVPRAHTTQTVTLEWDAVQCCGVDPALVSPTIR